MDVGEGRVVRTMLLTGEVLEIALSLVDLDGGAIGNISIIQ